MQVGPLRRGLRGWVWFAGCFLRSPVRDNLCRREGKETGLSREAAPGGRAGTASADSSGATCVVANCKIFFFQRLENIPLDIRPASSLSNGLRRDTEAVFSGVVFIASAPRKGSFPSYAYAEAVRAFMPLAMFTNTYACGLVTGTIMNLLQEHLP